MPSDPPTTPRAESRRAGALRLLPERGTGPDAAESRTRPTSPSRPSDVRRPVAYIRRSVARRNDPGDVSRQFQTDKVRELAGADGPALTVIDQDWGRSAAGDKTEKRLAFLGLLEAVERGEVSLLCAYSADRLARSVRWAAQLLDACEEAGTTIVTGEGRFTPGDEMARQMFHFQAMQNEGTLRQMTTKARSGVAARDARGDKLGRAPYGYRMARDADNRVIHVPNPTQPVEPVIEAFREAGSFAGAARLLNTRGLRSPDGARSWSGNSVGRVIRRSVPQELTGRRVEPRVRVKGNFTLARLLRCSCGQVMTGRSSRHTTKYGTYGPYTSYLCFRGRYEASHPRPYIVSEREIMPFVHSEVALLGEHAPIAGTAVDDQLQSLQAARERLGWAVVDGLLTREQAAAKSQEIDGEIAGLELDSKRIDIPEIDWSWSPRDLNEILTIIFDRIELDAEMRPVRAVWRRPEWRR